MPHLSPMHWMMMLVASWTMLMLIFTSLYFMDNKWMTKPLMMIEDKNMKWMWFQDKMNCKFMSDYTSLLMSLVYKVHLSSK